MDCKAELRSRGIHCDSDYFAELLEQLTRHFPCSKFYDKSLNELKQKCGARGLAKDGPKSALTRSLQEATGELEHLGDFQAVHKRIIQIQNDEIVTTKQPGGKIKRVARGDKRVRDRVPVLDEVNLQELKGQLLSEKSRKLAGYTFAAIDKLPNLSKKELVTVIKNNNGVFKEMAWDEADFVLSNTSKGATRKQVEKRGAKMISDEDFIKMVISGLGLA